MNGANVLKSLGIGVLLTLLVSCASADNASKHNLKVNTLGYFEITRFETNSASFTFRDRTVNAANSNLEYFEVASKPGEDLRLVMVRRMIERIRKLYQGDFDWASQRLGRNIVKSARLEDSAELEDFLMQEFFGSDYKTHTVKKHPT